MIKIHTVAGGCSFIWGSELRDSPHGGPNGYSRHTFPALLARDHYHCLAYPGYSNSDISRAVLAQLEHHRENSVVMVCWSWPNRDGVRSSPSVILELQDFCVKHDVPYLFTCADNCLIDLLTPYDIDWRSWFLFPPGTEHWQTRTPRGFYQWAVENKYDTGKDGHPLEAAHQDAADLIKGRYDDMVVKHLQKNPA